VNITDSILFIELIATLPPTESSQVLYLAELVARLDGIDSQSSKGTGAKNDNDIQRLFGAPLSFNQNKLKNLLSQFAETVKSKKIELLSNTKIEATDDISKKLFKIYSSYFPHRIIAKKSGVLGLSSNGRGVELSNESSCQQFEFYVALSGYEKNDSTTVVSYAVGVSKIEAIKILAENTQYTQNIFFDETSEVFFKQDTLYFGSFKLNEKSKERLATSDLNKTWKEHVRSNSSEFLKLNPSYQRLLELFYFLKSKQAELKIETQQFSFMENFDIQLSDKLSSVIDSFDDFKSADIYYYVKDLMPENIYDLLAALPKNMKLPSGKHVEVNYTDPKSPMISAKIQDCFGWLQTPQILNGRLRLTLQLLAPNMRPTQTTSDLENFWKNSYLDVRKDLRARYPKHSWPEDPTKF
jgi:ATP-dependent helicase HrpB